MEVKREGLTVSEANGIMTEIVNRVLLMHPIYEGVAVEIEDSAKGLVAWNLLVILNVYRQTNIYLKGRRQPKFVPKKHYAVKKVWTKWGWKRILNRATIMEFGFDNTGEVGELIPNYAEPFAEVGEETLREVARTLYGWRKEEETNELER